MTAVPPPLLTPFAAPPITIGELTDVPAPKSRILSQWAQEVSTRIIQRFATVAERDAKWPASAAPTGAMCIVTGTTTFYVCTAGQWQALYFPRLHRAARTVASVPANTTATVCTLAIPAYPTDRQALVTWSLAISMTTSQLMDIQFAQPDSVFLTDQRSSNTSGTLHSFQRAFACTGAVMNASIAINTWGGQAVTVKAESNITATVI